MKIFIKTFGCTLNKSDSEVMAGLLEKEGYKIVNEGDKVDLIIVNTCTVKGPTENKFYRYLKKVMGWSVVKQSSAATLYRRSKTNDSSTSQGLADNPSQK